MGLRDTLYSRRDLLSLLCPKGEELAYREQGAIAGLKEKHRSLVGGDVGRVAVALVEGD